MFWITLQIVMGVIAPLVLVAMVMWLLDSFKLLAKAKMLIAEKKLEDAKKSAPYDSVEVSQPPNPNMFTLRLIKDGGVVFQNSYDKELKES